MFVYDVSVNNSGLFLAFFKVNCTINLQASYVETIVAFVDREYFPLFLFESISIVI